MKQAMAVFLFCMVFFWATSSRRQASRCLRQRSRSLRRENREGCAGARAPEAGKARIVFIGRIDAPGCLGCDDFAPRIGVDGSWVGATKGNSYFVLDVAPGTHNVCADWKSISAARGRNWGVASFSAEPGQTYFFETKIEPSGEGPSDPSRHQNAMGSGFETARRRQGRGPDEELGSCDLDANKTVGRARV